MTTSSRIFEGSFCDSKFIKEMVMSWATQTPHCFRKFSLHLEMRSIVQSLKIVCILYLVLIYLVVFWHALQMCCQVTVLISLLTWCNVWRHLCHGKIYEQRRWVGSNSWFILARSHTACIPHLILHSCPLNRIKPFKGVKITWKLIKCPSTVNNYFKLPSFYKIRQICAWNPFTSLSRQIRTHTDRW